MAGGVVRIRRRTGLIGSPVNVDITAINTRANAEDAHSTAGVANAVKIPTVGNKYSFWAITRLFVSSLPSGTIDNLKWFVNTPNPMGSGVTIIGQNAAVYVQATGVVGDTGNQLTVGNYPGLTGGPVDVFTNFPIGSPKNLAGTITSPTTGDVGDFFIYQVQVGTTATSGVKGPAIMNWRYDET